MCSFSLDQPSKQNSLSDTLAIDTEQSFSGFIAESKDLLQIDGIGNEVELGEVDRFLLLLTQKTSCDDDGVERPLADLETIFSIASFLPFSRVSVNKSRTFM